MLFYNLMGQTVLRRPVEPRQFTMIGMVSPSRKAPLRSSLRYAPVREAFPMVTGWPFAWIEITAEASTFGTGIGRWAPCSRSKWTVERDDTSKIQRTQNGVRFYAKNRSEPWVTAFLAGRRFLRQLAELAIDAPGPIQPITWTSI